MAEVYWIHLPEHTDMFSEGYIGVTSRSVGDRYREHVNLARLGNNSKLYNAMRKYATIVNTICVCSEEYAYYLEEKLRPRKRIAWNTQKGGFAPPSQLGKKRVPRKRVKGTAKHRQETSDRMKVFWATKTAEERREMTSHLQLFTNTPEVSEKIRIAKIGYKVSDDVLLKMTLAQQKYAKEHVEDKRAVAKIMRKTAEETPWLIKDARKDVWYCADEIFGIMKKFPHYSRAQILKEHGKFVKNDVVALYKRLEAGWNPSADKLWTNWKNTNNIEVAPTRGNKVNVGLWRNSKANNEVWLLADKVYNLFTKNPKIGLKRVAKNIGGFGPDAFETMLYSIRDGWVPCLDQEWLVWAENQNRGNNAT